MLVNRLLRYWHTLRHLKPVQIYGRLWFKLYCPSPELHPAPPLRELTGGWQLPAQRAPSLLGPERFNLLGEEGTLSEVGWTGEVRSKLWRYHQHYFDDLNAQRSATRSDWHRHLLFRWVKDNPPGHAEGWEPYPISLRIVNSIKWALAGNSLPPEYTNSLAVQTRWLMRRLEVHLQGNHLFSNAKALVFAGCFFAGDESERWLAAGLSILAREIPEQLLPDGGHFERSTMYHALALEDMLDIFNVTRYLSRAPSQADGLQGSVMRSQLTAYREDWVTLIEGMIDWLGAMCHPDGEISFFNDSALGVAPPTSALLQYAERLGFNNSISARSCFLSESGYIRLSNDAAVLLFDMAPVGPDYLPGHAHADTLSFELGLFGQRVFVNSGTSSYDPGPERSRQRGTAAHNTVVVSDEDSSEVWGSFRVARRARVSGVKTRLNGPSLSGEAYHDGYRRLPSPVMVWRRVCLESTGLLIEDELLGNSPYAVAYLHLHPAIVIKQTGSYALQLQCSDDRQLILRFRGAELVALEDSIWHPEFGRREPNKRVKITFLGGRLETFIGWDML